MKQTVGRIITHLDKGHGDRTRSIKDLVGSLREEIVTERPK